MTTDELELGKNLNDKIKKLKSFLHYYKDNRYRLSIHLDNKDDSCYHSVTFCFDDEDIILSEMIEKNLNSKLAEMQKRFDEL